MDFRRRTVSALAVGVLACLLPASSARGAGGAAPAASETAPAIGAAGTELYVIPSSAHSPGVANTSWVSDVVLHNPNGVDLTTNVYFLKVGQDNTTAEGHEVPVAAGQSVLLADIVQSTFGQTSTSGAILVGAPRFLIVTSRTFNDATAGTYGQYIPGLHVLQAIGRNQEARLLQLTRNDLYRTNLGIANATGNLLNVTADLYRADGTKLGSRGYAVLPWSYYQENDVLGKVTGDVVDDAYAIVKAPNAGARYFAYGSVIDNRTGDPVCIVPVRPGAPTDPIYVPGTAHQSGIAGTNWRTDLEVANPGAAAVEFTVELLKRDQANPTPESHTVTLQAAQATRLADILDQMFAFSGSATLRVTPTSGNVLATSRTYNDQPTGTYGQFVAGVPSSAAVTRGHDAILAQLSQSAVPTEGFRTNVGLVNASATPTFVDVKLYNATAALLGTASYGLESFKSIQVAEIYKTVTADPVVDGFAVVSTATVGARLFAYASVIDNRSGDPVYVPAQVADALCTYQVSPLEGSAPAAGGAVAVAVTTNAGSCAWTAVSAAPWITPQPASGFGSATVTLTVAANPGLARTGTVKVAGSTVTVSQGTGCAVALNPTSAHFATAGGTGSTQVDATASECPWTATSDQAWLTITGGASGKGDGTVSFSVAASTSVGTRTGTLSIGSQTFTVTQDGMPPLPSLTLYLPGDVPMVGLLIPPGSFQMGSPDSELGRDSDEGPRHQVILTGSFFISATEVTQRQWAAVMNYNPATFASCGPDCPVERVSWTEITGANGFLAKLNAYLQITQQPGAGKLRLPTEAEWEYAARAGTATRFPWGDVLSCADTCAACAAHEQAMWWCGDAEDSTHQVQSKASNPWGLFDMSGNVWEWVADYYGAYSSAAQTDPTGPATGSLRVYRGGEWYTWASYCRSASRGSGGADYRSSHVGFRVAATP